MCNEGDYLFQCLFTQDMTCFPQNRKSVAAIHGKACEGTCKVCSICKLEVSSSGTSLLLCFILQQSLISVCAAIGPQKHRS